VGVGADTDQVAGALIAGVQLLEAPYGIQMLWRNQMWPSRIARAESAIGSCWSSPSARTV
jgi:hypothetical protein